MATIALAPGQDRAVMIRAALDALPDAPDVAAAGRIVVKPDMAASARPLAATHAAALRAVLLWLRDRGARAVTVAGGGAGGATLAGFAARGYFALAGIPGLRVDFADLDADEAVPLTLYDRALRPQAALQPRSLVESDLCVSVARPKTHDAVIVTGALKNVLLGSQVGRRASGPRWRAGVVAGLLGMVPGGARALHRLAEISPGLAGRLAGADGATVHQGYPVANLNLYLLARAVRPHLAVLDGLIGMHGEGPVYGAPVHLGWAAASTDAVAADAAMAHLMGLDPAGIGYLQYCGRAGLGAADLAEIAVIGPPLSALQHPCRPHSTHEAQLRWADPAVERLFQSLSATAARRE